MLRGEPITVYGGRDKTLDFTYVDDCVDGIARGIEALAEGRVVNQTINLAYGQGNTLVHVAERIAAELGVEPDMTIAPSLLGEVTHYVADLSKARDLLGYDPKVPLDEGISRAVAWFREHREAHPGGERPHHGRPRGQQPGRCRARLEDSPGYLLVAIFGPTASGKSAVAEAIAERIPAELVSADSMQVYRGLPILTNQDARARLVGIWPLDRQGTVGEFQVLAHEAIDEIVAAGQTAVVVGGSGLWFQAALTDVRLPADVPADAGARWEQLYDRRGAETAHSLLQARDPVPQRRCTERPQARRARLELWQAGGTLVPEEPRLWSAELRLPTLVAGLEVPRETLAARISERTAAMFEQGVEDEVRAAGDVVPQVLGLDAVRELPRPRRSPSSSVGRCASPPTSGWMRRIPGIVMIDADRPVGEVADAILEVARTR